MVMLAVKENVKTRTTSELALPVQVNYDLGAKLELRLKSFLNKPEWIYESLSLIDKAISNRTFLTEYDVWALNRLDLVSKIEYGNLVLMDRYNNVLTINTLKTLKNKIVGMTATYAAKLLKKPELHHMEKAFTNVLKKAMFQELNQEETSILKDAYLKVENGKIVNLKGDKVKLPRLGILKFFMF